jgi:hypothetical protein
MRARRSEENPASSGRLILVRSCAETETAREKKMQIAESRLRFIDRASWSAAAFYRDIRRAAVTGRIKQPRRLQGTYGAETLRQCHCGHDSTACEFGNAILSNLPILSPSPPG